MSDELQKQLAAMLAQLGNFAGDASKFASEQIPPLVQEKIALGRIEGTVWFLASIVVVWFVVSLWRRLRRWQPEDDDDKGLAFAGLGVLSLGAFALFSLAFHTCATAWFAPRLFIVEWLTALVQK